MLRAFRTFFCCASAFFIQHGCDSGDCDTNVEHRLTIKQGVYGQATYHDDVGPHPVECFEGFRIQVFLDQPSADPNDGAPPFADTVAGQQGLFELALAARHYWICTSFRRCQAFDVKSGQVTRLDYFFGVAGGWSF